jgi:hypothetical protein
MHRPGIASIYDDTIHLDGTTIDEVKSYHRETLILATNEANTKYIGLLEIKKRKQLQEQQRLENHKRNIDDVAKDIKF